MKGYQIKIDTDAYLDIQEARDWYNERGQKLGERFKKNVTKQINALKNNTNNYSVRYKDVRCMLVRKFPFLVHFTIDEKNQIIIVLALIHTSRNPEIWKQKTKKS